MIVDGWGVDDVARVGSGKTLWKIISFWYARGGYPMASLQRVDRPDVHTSCDVARLRPAAAAGR